MAPAASIPDKENPPVKGSTQQQVSQTTWIPGRQGRFNRIIIYPKDIQCITGKSERYGRMMIRRVKEHFHKADHQLVTLDEFCQYAGLKLEEVAAFLG